MRVVVSLPNGVHVHEAVSVRTKAGGVYVILPNGTTFVYSLPEGENIDKLLLNAKDEIYFGAKDYRIYNPEVEIPNTLSVVEEGP